MLLIKKANFVLKLQYFLEWWKKILAASLKGDLVYSHQSFAEEWLLFCACVLIKKVFVAEENSGLHKRELLRYHESFPILVFEGSLQIEIAL